MERSVPEELLDKALKRHKELLLELEALKRFIEDYSQIVRTKGREVRLDEPQLFQPPSPRAAHAEHIAEMIDAARRIILAEQRPMKRGDLRKRVESLGYKIIGQDKNKVFGTNLWRSRKFRMIDGLGYWPIDEALPGESGS